MRIVEKTAETKTTTTQNVGWMNTVEKKGNKEEEEVEEDRGKQEPKSKR